MYIYSDLPRNAIVRLSHPRSGDRQGQETFLVAPAYEQTLSLYIYIYLQGFFSAFGGSCYCFRC